MKTFNFIATTYKGLENEAMAELLSTLAVFGDVRATVSLTVVSGLLTGFTFMEAEAISKRLIQMVEMDPWSIRLILRFIPVERVVAADIEDIVECVKAVSNKIGQDESFRITIEKRHTQLKSSEIIQEVGDVVSRRVDLDNPNWIVLIEIVRNEAGISVIRPEVIFSSLKAKRGS